tara:strand:+ start:142 stop:1050 length:909 start_codon:yes stop_codon:yes gene_type:complete
MEIIELFIDETDEVSGIEAISVVENPAIESDFVALKQQEFKLAEVDKEKRILMGAALIPNKPIYRQSGEQEYYIYFSQATVRKASELFFINGNQNNTTLEHELQLKGLTAVESWIVESEQDKSRMYDLNVPMGTWMVSMKVNNDDVWKKVKAGEVKGFSIEGYFADKLERPNEPVKQSKMSKEEVAEAKIEELRQLFSNQKMGKEKVKLSLISDIKTQYQEVKSNNSKMLNIRKKYNDERNSLLSFAEIVEEQTKRMEQLTQKLINASKELGIEKPKEVDMYNNIIESYIQNVKEAKKAARS